MPSSRPRITFDERGFCNGCVYNSKRKLDIDWSGRKNNLKAILGSHKNSDTNKNYDCVVAWSGGKDSSAVALKLRDELDLNPLLVTFSPLIPTPEGDYNRRSLLRLGFDSILISPSLRTSSYLSKRFLVERGDPKFIGMLELMQLLSILRQLYGSQSSSMRSMVSPNTVEK